MYRQQLKTNKLVASLYALRIHPMDQLPLRLWQLSLCTGAAYKHKKAKPSTRKPCLNIAEKRGDPPYILHLILRVLTERLEINEIEVSLPALLHIYQKAQ